MIVGNVVILAESLLEFRGKFFRDENLQLFSSQTGTAGCWDCVGCCVGRRICFLKGQGSYSNLIRGFGFWFLPLTILKYIKMTSSGITWQRKLQIVIEEHCQKLSKISLVFQICIYTCTRTWILISAELFINGCSVIVVAWQGDVTVVNLRTDMNESEDESDSADGNTEA